MNAVNLEIGDKAYRLRYDFNAIADIEQQAGAGVGELFSEGKVGFNTIRLLLWGGLKWEDKGLTLQRAGMIVNEWIQQGNEIEDLMEYVQEALEKSGLFGEKKNEAGGEN